MLYKLNGVKVYQISEQNLIILISLFSHIRSVSKMAPNTPMFMRHRVTHDSSASNLLQNTDN